ncbi:type II toxin-antitoxin system RelE/ParE family toxin [Candidatus Gottesmanbacteria bacterium]|nr:type II toxin-antitoxin system RelE/ParE family toxin [Candidatus Gottesmanbacteria bacterium]
MKVILSETATKQLQKLPKVVHPRILRKLHLLESDPLVGKSLQSDLEGNYSVRAWPYRIFYVLVKEKRILLVTAIKHRQGAYK